MLDVLAIGFTSAMMIVVIVRALKADRTQPWFQVVRNEAKPIARNRPWQRRR